MRGFLYLFYMNISEIIRSIIAKLPKGYVFTYDVFYNKVESKEALVKALNRLAASGKIIKLAKGKYYKPEQSPFGELPLAQFQVVKDLLERNGKIEGYLTGLSTYNQLGLTTQVGRSIHIGKNEVRPTLKRGQYHISFIKQKNTITKENVPLLQLLDAIRFIKKIPDSEITNSVKILQGLVENLLESEYKTLVRLALKYPPATRALLGAILTNLDKSEVAVKLKKSLNPLTTYNFPKLTNILPAAPKWNIK